MLFPENPEKRPELWKSLIEQLTHEEMCYLVLEGVGYPDASATVDSEVAEKVVQRMRQSNVSRISASRGRAISPHFAANLEDAIATITEFVAYPSEGLKTVRLEKLRQDVETVVINLMFGGGTVDAVFLPLELEPWEMKDAEIQSAKKGVLFRKRI